MTPDRSDETRPLLVLLAGLLCDSAVWEAVAAGLAEVADVEILSFPSYSSMEDMADHVVATLARHPAAKPVALAGHSMGGRVALEVMRRAPDRIAALALLNTGVHPRREQEVEGRMRLVRLAAEQGMAALAAEWLPPMMGAPPTRVAEVLPNLIAMVERNTPESFSAQIQALLNRPDAQEVLPTIAVPTLLLSGSDDKWSPLSQHAEMLRFLPNGILVGIPQAGHMAPVEQPKKVALAMRDWLVRAQLCASDFDRGGEVERMLIERACERQIIRYAALTDAADYDAVAAMFTEDGTYARPSEPDRQIGGRAAILAGLQSRPPRMSRHLVGSIVVTVESDRRARATSRILLYLGGKGNVPAPLEQTLVGDFDDILVKVDGQWLFASRRGSVVIKG